ncbi:MAG: YbjN domain-containing protein [Spirochaetaceae bacterium]|nr:YbjN domain-containing protein [Spirochaetaceae bacterium]
MEKNKIEEYLIELMFTYREIDKNIWLLDDREHNLEGIAVMYDDPLVVFRVVVMDVPGEHRLELFTKLLELNASDVLHGAYALEDDKIVLINTLDYDTMDYGEFRSTLDAFSLALVQHYPILSAYR